jgi:putative ABC transport system substrate-binding protein
MAFAARRASRTIPIVVAAGGDLVAYRLVASLAKPGGNVTGLQTTSLELTGKRLELLRDVVAHPRRVAVLVPVAYSRVKVEEAQIAARALRLEIEVLRMRDTDDLAAPFRSVTSSRYDGLLSYSDPFAFLHRKAIVDLVATTHVPAIYEAREFVDAGGLMSYGPSIADLHRRAARYVDKILKGARAGDLPIEQPTKYELFINLKTAKALGLTIPPSLLQRADQVIE